MTAHAVAAPAVASARPPHAGWILAIILVAYFMIILDNSIVLTGIPRIQQELAFTTTGLSWVQSAYALAYALAFGGLLLLGARLGDVFGRRRMFLFGIAIFAAASLAISVAPTAEVMLVARAVQGVGSAIVAPSTLALLTSTFPEGSERTRAGSTADIGASVGLVLGGLVADLLSWRVGFVINAPIDLLLAIATLRFVAETEPRPGRFDIAGAVLSTLGMTALVFGIVESAESGRGDALTLIALAAGLALLAALVLVESRASQPIMPLSLFRSLERSGAHAARMFFIGAMMGFFFFFTTQYLQGVLGYGPLEAGLAFLPMTAVNFAVALAVPRLTRRFGSAALLVAGIAVTAIGMVRLSGVGVSTDYVTGVAAPMALIGTGQGLAFAPLTAAAMTGVAPRDAGAGSGLVNAVHQLGGSLGLSILVAVAVAVAVAAPATAALSEETACASRRRSPQGAYCS